jgi:hypothetical protein
MWLEIKTLNVVLVFTVGGAILGFVLFEPSFAVVIGSSCFCGLLGFFLIRHLKEKDRQKEREEREEKLRQAKEALKAKAAATAKKVGDVGKKVPEAGGKALDSVVGFLKKLVKK